MTMQVAIPGNAIAAICTDPRSHDDHCLSDGIRHAGMTSNQADGVKFPKTGNDAGVYAVGPEHQTS